MLIPEIAAALTRCRVIPVIRCANAEDGALAIDCALRAGFPTVEITLTMPDATEMLREFSRKLERHQFLGAGTVWDEATCMRVLDAGARYVVTPGLVPGLGAVAHAGRAAYLPGALTPSEIAAAVRDGADIVKLFPASTVGPKHLQAVAAVFPSTRFCPTGGISLENMDSWFMAGAVCVGIGNTLYQAQDLQARNEKALIEQARYVLDHARLAGR
jgi:2-dehydro-3-deoxyphosphogluconate aldolase / (4S)-4-hydroxy-2-oxoglutarate aldolase